MANFRHQTAIKMQPKRFALVVADCGLFSCPTIPMFERGRILELALKPLLLLYNVMGMVLILSCIISN